MNASPNNEAGLKRLLALRGWAPLWSRVLDAAIIIKHPGQVVPAPYDGWTAYTLDEVSRLAAGKHTPDGLRYIHQVKVLFDGQVLGETTDVAEEE